MANCLTKADIIFPELNLPYAPALGKLGAWDLVKARGAQRLRLISKLPTQRFLKTGSRTARFSRDFVLRGSSFWEHNEADWLDRCL